jgi:hypothetical protein
MYNFRYHLVTIVSIFAALALGLLLGVAITGSDLVRDASNNLAESLTEQFNELNATNENLSDQLQSEQLLADELLSGWQTDRLQGRTIAIMTREAATSDSLASELSAYVSRSGGIPIILRIDQTRGLLPTEEGSLSALRQILPAVEGEDYELTLARALTDEWSFTVRAGVLSIADMFEGNYPLTAWLVKEKRLDVVVSYRPLLDALATTGTLDVVLPPTPLSMQRTAYELAAEKQLPYGVNGVINTAVFLSSEGASATIDPVALQIALQFEQKGQAGELPYQHFVVTGVKTGETATGGTGAGNGETGTLNPSTTGQDSSQNPSQDSSQISLQASYYAVLVQQGDLAESMLVAAQETGLPCELSPLDKTGRYSVVALLSGADKGNYGLDRRGMSPLPPIPADSQGNAVFALSVPIDSSPQETPEDLVTEEPTAE